MHRTGGTKLTSVDQKETSGAHEFVRLLWRHAFRYISRSPRFRYDFFIFFIFVVGSGDSIFQNRIEVGFDVVGIEIFLFVFFVLTLRTGSKRGVSRCFFVFFVFENSFDEHLFEVFDKIALEVFTFEIDVDFFLVEFFFDGIVSHGVLALGPSQGEAKVIRAADDRHVLGWCWCHSCR